MVPIVDSAYGIPARAATRATAGSPSVCIIRVKPVGPNTSGSAAGRPRITVAGSIADTSWSTRGWNSTDANAARDRRRLISSPAPPSV